MSELAHRVVVLEESLPQLEVDRQSSGLANSVFEAADYWIRLGRWAIENDTRINYPARSAEEKTLLRRLECAAVEASEQQKYEATFAAARDILDSVAEKLPERAGHLGVLKVLDREFAFLERDYGFRLVSEEPTGRKYSSDKVWVELEWLPLTNLSCTFGKVSDDTPLWPAALLRMNGDPRYLDVWKGRPLQNARDVEVWFRELADIWHKYGRDILTAQPGAFEKAAEALTQIDADIARTARDGE